MTCDGGCAWRSGGKRVESVHALMCGCAADTLRRLVSMIRPSPPRAGRHRLILVCRRAAVAWFPRSSPCCSCGGHLRGLVPIHLPTFCGHGTSAASICRVGDAVELCADGGTRMQRGLRRSSPWRSAVSVGIYIRAHWHSL